MTDAPENTKLFISYAWTSEEHKQWVLRLAEKLVASGVDVKLDQWELKLGHDKNFFMERMLTDPDIRKVLMIFNKDYADKANDRKGGVGTETQIISKEMYENKGQDKFAGAILEKDEKGEPYLPNYYRSRIYLDFSNPNIFEEEFEKLRLWIRDQTLNVKPLLGEPLKTDSWTDREICRAAVKTYFSLEDMPVDSEDNGDFMGFESAAGYIYTCRIEGNIAILKWINGTGDAMSSRKTSFKRDGNTLIVTDNSMGVMETFEKD